MTAIATGSLVVVTDESFAQEPAPVKLAALVIVVVGAVSFAREHRIAVRRGWRAPRSFGRSPPDSSAWSS